MPTTNTLTTGIYALTGSLADNETGPGQTGGILAIAPARRANKGRWCVLNADGRTSIRTADELIAAGVTNVTVPS